MGDTSSACQRCGDRSGLCECPDYSVVGARYLRVDPAAQHGGFTKPPGGLNAQVCPVCNGPTQRGFGLMGGGYGPYVACASADDCYWYYKEQEEPEQPPPHPDAVPDSVYSVIVRYVPVATGGPRHDTVCTCERCGAEYTWSSVGPNHNYTGFDRWTIDHRKECSGK